MRTRPRVAFGPLRKDKAVRGRPALRKHLVRKRSGINCDSRFGAYGRGAGVGRGLGVGEHLPVHGVDVAVGVAVGVGVGVGLPVPGS